MSDLQPRPSARPRPGRRRQSRPGPRPGAQPDHAKPPATSRAACQQSARPCRAGPRRIVTGFFIPTAEPPAGETDGPLGAVFLARALVPLGVRVCDRIGRVLHRRRLDAGLAACGFAEARPGRHAPRLHAEARAPLDRRLLHALPRPDRAPHHRRRTCWQSSAFGPSRRHGPLPHACAAATSPSTRAPRTGCSRQRPARRHHDHRHRRRRQRDRHGQDRPGRDRAATFPRGERHRLPRADGSPDRRRREQLGGVRLGGGRVPPAWHDAAADAVRCSARSGGFWRSWSSEGRSWTAWWASRA